MKKATSDFSFHIETLGCPKNKVDSRRMRADLLQSGFKEAKGVDESDFVLINSCSFIKEAQEETIETVFSALNLKQVKPETKVGLIGCFAERFSDAVKDEIPELDFIVGTGQFNEVASIIANQYELESKPHEAAIWENADVTTEKPYSYFRIARGCSRNCSFCILPTIRGSLATFNLEEIETQYQSELALRQTVDLKEVILVSQDTIGQGNAGLEEIIAYFSAKPEIEFIRLQYLFPDKRVLKLLDLYKKYTKLVPYLDIPFQHASAKMLKAMNRPDNIEIFKEIVDKARSIHSNLEVRTSFIVGYPGEDDGDIAEIKNLITDLEIDKVALFRYSHEEGTPAFTKFEDVVEDQVKIDRINEIRNYHLQSRIQKRKKLEGKTEKVIVDEISDKDIIARRLTDSPEIDEVVFISKSKENSCVKVGDVINVEIMMPMEYDWIAIYVNHT